MLRHLQLPLLREERASQEGSTDIYAWEGGWDGEKPAALKTQ